MKNIEKFETYIQGVWFNGASIFYEHYLKVFNIKSSQKHYSEFCEFNKYFINKQNSEEIKLVLLKNEEFTKKNQEEEFKTLSRTKGKIPIPNLRILTKPHGMFFDLD